jgi:DNA invertase Pin-like site-specific DNA recombinase
MVYAYARVSSDSQNLDRQITALTPYVSDARCLITDKASGKNFERKGYRMLVGTEETMPLLHKDDTLVITSLDRLGRDYESVRKEYAHITQDLGVDIIILDMPILNSCKEQGLEKKFLASLVLEVLAFNAAKERESIKRRQAEGIACAKAKGMRFGRPTIAKPENWQEVTTEWKNGSITAREAMNRLGLKPNTFYRLLKKAA